MLILTYVHNGKSNEIVPLHRFPAIQFPFLAIVTPFASFVSYGIKLRFIRSCAYA